MQTVTVLFAGNRIASVVLYNVNVPGVPQHPVFWSATTDEYGAPAGVRDFKFRADGIWGKKVCCRMHSSIEQV